MISRIKQFLAALTAGISDSDRRFVNGRLSAREQTLFWQMNLPDQYHAVKVAYTALAMAENKGDADKAILERSALLHDVGKVKDDVSTADKIITVLAHKFMPQWARQWGRPGRGSRLDNIRHAFYIYFHHAERSADMLERIGTDRRIVELVRKHHEAPAECDPPELAILRAADNMN
jgi:putative nucleotidyltransferase with HDIG domain